MTPAPFTPRYCRSAPLAVLPPGDRDGQALRQGPPNGSRAGVTLLEFVVVMAMLGLFLAVAAPAFIVPKARPSQDLGAVLASAKRAAVLRGEPVTLTIDDVGAWTLAGDANATAALIASGTLDPSPGRARVRVSPLGTCIPAAVAAIARDWSAVGCGPVSSPEMPTP